MEKFSRENEKCFIYFADDYAGIVLFFIQRKRQEVSCLQPKRTVKDEMVNWVFLTSEKEVFDWVERSKLNKVVVFKHSTRCFISSSVKKKFEKDWDEISDEDIFLVDVLQNRSISDLLAQKFSVTHQSPQVLVIEDGDCIYHASHEAIQASAVFSQN